MTVEDMAQRVQDAINVRRVFGEPHTSDGVTVIPVASVRAGAGGGSGTDPDDGSSGEGGGFGGSARPIGAYVIQDGRVSWRPAVDVNRLIVWASVVLLTFILLVSRVQRTRLTHRKAAGGTTATDATVVAPAANGAAGNHRRRSRAPRRPGRRRRAARRASLG